MIIDKLNIGDISSNNAKDLDVIIEKSPEASIFQTIHWNKALFETFNNDVKILIAKDHIAPLGYFISTQRFISSPRTLYCSPDRSLETVYGGPIVVSGTDEHNKIRRELVKRCHYKVQPAIIEIWLPPDASPKFLEQIGYAITPFYTSIIDLEAGEDNLWQNIHQKTRNQIRKAQKCKVQIIKDGTPYLSEYYEMVKETLGSKDVKVLPEEFYQTVMEILEPKNMAKLFLAIHDGKAIAGAIFLFFKDTVYYWHGASFKQYRSVSPNNLIQWELIKYAHQSGYKKYDLLSIEPDRLPGISRFKMRFGGETKTYYRCLWKTPFYRLPVIRHYIKHPSYLCRMTGNLYRMTSKMFWETKGSK